MKRMVAIFSLLSLSSILTAGDLISGLSYSDDQTRVIAKLEKSKLVKSTIPKTMFGRVGLNGTFKTLNKLKGLHFSLYFDWTDQGQLKQLTFRSDPMPSSAYNGKVRAAWSHSINLLSSMYGKPSNVGDYPKSSKLSEGGIYYSHEWKTSEGYIYVGTAKQNGKYHLAITFTNESLIAQ